MSVITIQKPASLTFIENYSKAIDKQANQTKSGSGSSSKQSQLASDLHKIQDLRTSNNDLMNLIAGAAAKGDAVKLQVYAEALSMRNNLFSAVSNLINKMEEGISSIIRNIR